jgi:hypothetical protein
MEIDFYNDTIENAKRLLKDGATIKKAASDAAFV